MQPARRLKGEKCTECGEDELIWWIKEETEKIIELYMNCRNCEHEYPKQVVSKTEDTSNKALTQKLKQKL